jgi:haloacetate dehalogenase
MANLSALLPGFARRRVQAGEVALHVAVGGDGVITAEALAAYREAFADPRTIHATCEDYRAGATVDALRRFLA